MSDCRFGVSPVNYPDPDPDDRRADSHCLTALANYYTIIINLNFVIWKLTSTIFSHCVPLPAPGPPRTNITLYLAMLNEI